MSDDNLISEPVDFSDVEIPQTLGKRGFNRRTHIKGYLPFPTPITSKPYQEWSIESYPQLLFRPEALMCWDYDAVTVITLITIGNKVEGAVAPGEVPASFFGTAKTYEKLLEDFAKNGISPPNWVTWSTCKVGERVLIRGKGYLKHAVMLGTGVY